MSNLHRSIQFCIKAGAAVCTKSVGADSPSTILFFFSAMPVEVLCNMETDTVIEHLEEVGVQSNRVVK